MQLDLSPSSITPHAALRMAQRNVSLDDAALVIAFGTLEHRTGVEFYFLAAADIPNGQARELDRLIGTTVVIRQGRIETVYRNRRAHASIRRKSKRASQSRFLQNRINISNMHHGELARR